jgi:dihydrofolate synthase/folylpolyglutamate synthase
MAAADVAEAARALGVTVYAEPDPRNALRLARGLAEEIDLIVVAGSLYIVGALRGDVLDGAIAWEA